MVEELLTPSSLLLQIKKLEDLNLVYSSGKGATVVKLFWTKFFQQRSQRLELS